MSELVTRPVSALPPGTAVAKFLGALVEGHGDVVTARRIAASMKSTPHVYATFDQLVTKAAVAPGTTTDAAWASALVSSGLATEALSVMRGMSVVDTLAGRMRKVPFNVKVPREATAPLIGGWATEAAPLPATDLVFNALGPLARTKIGAITALTKELLVAGTPTTDQVVTRAVLGGLAAQLDLSFLDPTSGATAGRPAAITNGATAITSTGSTAAAIAADLGSMLAAITTNGQALSWIMKPATAARVSAALGAASDVPRTLYGLPVTLSSNSPQQITLVDLGAILLADDGEFETNLSESSSLQMTTTPMSPADATTVYVSLYQANAVGIRAVRWINWLRGVSGSVVYMTVTY